MVRLKINTKWKWGKKFRNAFESFNSFQNIQHNWNNWNVNSTNAYSTYEEFITDYTETWNPNLSHLFECLKLGQITRCLRGLTTLYETPFSSTEMVSFCLNVQKYRRVLYLYTRRNFYF